MTHPIVVQVRMNRIAANRLMFMTVFFGFDVFFSGLRVAANLFKKSFQTLFDVGESHYFLVSDF